MKSLCVSVGFLTLPQLPIQSVSYYYCVCVCVFRDRVSLYSPGCLGTHSVDQAGLKLRNLPVKIASQVLGLMACTTTSQHFVVFLKQMGYLSLSY